MQADQLPALADLLHVLRKGGPAAVREWWNEMEPPAPDWVEGITEVPPPEGTTGAEDYEILIVRCPDGSHAVELWDDFCQASGGLAAGDADEPLTFVIERSIQG